MSARLLDDLRRLGLSPGASVAELKPAWRRAVSQLHPDRHGSTATPALAEVNAAFARLEAFARAHGRLPGPADRELAAPPPRPGKGRRVTALLALLTVGVFVLWPQPPAPPVDSREPPPALPSAPSATIDASAGAVVQTMSPKPRQAPAGTPRRLELGMPKAEVERLLGSPLFRSDGRWEYGPSSVHFEHGRVTGWHSSPLRPLPVAMPHTSPGPPTE